MVTNTTNLLKADGLVNVSPVEVKNANGTQDPKAPPTPAQPAPKDEFKATSPDKRKGAWEFLSNLAGNVGGMVKLFLNVGSAASVAGALLGGPPAVIALLGVTQQGAVPYLVLPTSLLGIGGGALQITEGARTAKGAAINHQKFDALDGTLQVVQGLGVVLTSIGLGPIPAAAAAGAFGLRIINAVASVIADKLDNKEKLAQAGAKH